MGPSPVSSSSKELDVMLDQLDQLEEIVLQGLRLPLTGMLLVDEDDVIEALNRIRESFPPTFQQAQALIDQRQDYLKQTQVQGASIIQQVKDKREQVIQQSVQEGERRAKQVLAEAAAQRDMMLDKARQAVAQQEQVLQKKMEQTEQQFAARRSQLEQEYIIRKEEQNKQLEQRRLQALQELERINQEKVRRKERAQREVEDMRQDMRTLCQKAHAHCEELARQATATRQEADHYARQVLDDLSNKLRDLQQVVCATRQGSGSAAVSAHDRPTATPRQRTTAPQGTVATTQFRAHEDRRSA
ncbi:hypothetical protein [Candidatus Synechococcus spongiarum]|uniref:Uncharacterized protein n=1 Tax=Candidatus Synechococcus spongiarum TaxID=431041 RepID=A0A171DGH7_9SYNE|nr:hypothetical protein [Candidatus Synechococcus spongiarum]SAY38801.1 hypothetical protein FLM9_769 [Candidatus Synechococcus spongiarum]